MSNELYFRDTPASTMSSIEIAELVDKSHYHVIRDIRGMAEKLNIDLTSNLDGIDFKGVFVEKREDNGQTKAIHLNRYLTEVLITGYDVVRRAAVIKRWHDLETGEAASLASTSANATLNKLMAAISTEAQTQIDDLHVTFNTCKLLNLDDINTLVALKAAITSPTATKLIEERLSHYSGSHNHIPNKEDPMRKFNSDTFAYIHGIAKGSQICNELPANMANDKCTHLPLSTLLTAYGVQVKATVVNKKLEELGIVTRVKATPSYWYIADEKYGINKKRGSRTLPLFTKSTFEDLLTVAGLLDSADLSDSADS